MRKLVLPDSERKAIALMVMGGVFAMLLAIGISIWNTNRTDNKAEKRTTAAIKEAEQRQAEDLRRWCNLLRLLDDINKQAPPATDPNIIRYRVEVHDLRVGYGC